MMTLRDAIRELAPLGISLRKQDGEFQVKPRADSWESPSVYFTDDIDDAYNTGRQMAQRGNMPLSQKAEGPGARDGWNDA